MSSTKSALKAIGVAIHASRYDEAIEQARKLLATDAKNYQAYIFLGFALDKQNQLPQSERAYEQAAELKPTDPQAWQGLLRLCQKQGGNKIGLYQSAALRLAEIYRDADDRYKCQDVIDQFIIFAKSQGTRQQHKQSLEILLPSSPVYEYLEGRIPHPSHTYQTIAEITEADEKERINKEIGERRTRLGAKISQVTIDVHREIFRESPLEDLYSKVIDWSNDDDVRRNFEEKLLQRCYDDLVVTLLQEKGAKRSKVQKLASDMVIIKHPYKLAWDIAIEWNDYVYLAQWDAGVLREYVDFFPDSGLAKVLEAFLGSEISPFPTPKPVENRDSDESEDDEGGGGVKLSLAAEDRLLLMIAGFSDASNSILAHRIIGEYYSFIDEHESIVEAMRAGLKLITGEIQRTGMAFPITTQVLTALLATALVFYQSPKNHPEAKVLFDCILLQNPTSTAALIGIGLIYEEEEDFPAAINSLERALIKDPENIRIRAEAAWVKALNGKYEDGRHELETCLSTMEGQDVRSRDLRAQTQHRIGICIWNMDDSLSARKNRTGAYAYFLAALKTSLNYAPAYTSLGIFYSDYSKDKKRARKCFQKAFELSPSEVEAAERLARSFADQAEWDLVEVVAQRVISSGKVRPSPGSKKKGFSWPFAALGVAELNKQEYAKSIVSFQSALRITPNDYHSWVGLGESYHNSGRYMAATKAFTHAEKFESQVKENQPGDTWFARYMLANVKRELGQYDESIRGYKKVLILRPEELGVHIALIQTLVESAGYNIERGNFGQATQLAREAIIGGRTLIQKQSDTFNLWKAMGDACSVFSVVQGNLADFPHDLMKEILQIFSKDNAYTIFTDVDGVGTELLYSEGKYPDDEQHGLDLTRCLQAAILCHKRAIQAAIHDMHAQAIAYYNLGWAEHRAHICLGPIMRKKSTRYLKAAVAGFKRAIELEASNAEFWNALGVVTSEVAPKIAQHAFVRSLFLNERSASAWANLGTLYLLQNDLQLANEAFTRAQSADPDFAHAWLGQGLVALLFGDPSEARLLFTHAFEISESSSLLVKRQYATSTFDHLVTRLSESSITDLIPPIFALNQLQSLAPDDLNYQHLASLFLERVENVSAALAQLSATCTTIEADFEVTESPTSLSRYVLAKADLARSQLAAGLYGEAIESGDTALQLSEDDAGNVLGPEARRKCRLSAHLTVGLANYHLHDVAALTNLEAALEEAGGDPDAICLLAQVLWATSDDESRDKARDQLFDCVEKHPSHAQSVLILGAISLLDGDTESLEAVTSDLVALRTSKSTSSAEQAMVGEILRAAAALSDEDPEQAMLREIQSEVFMFPSQPHGWARLANIDGNEYAAEMALKTAIRAAPPRGELDAFDLAQAFAGTENIGDAQRAIMVAPWSQAGWGVLSSCISS